MPSLLRADTLTAGYGESIVLDGVSLEVEEGGSLALLGRNGVGKTTLLLTLMGLTRLKSGTLNWQGADITAVSTFKRAHAGIGWVPQERLGFSVAYGGRESYRRMRGPAHGISSACTKCFRASTSASEILATSCPAASSRWRRSRVP